MKIAKGQYSASSFLGGSSRPIRIADTAGQATITQTFGAGTDDEYTFSWTLSGVAQSGTFRDGSPWVVPSNGSSVILKDATPQNTTSTVDNIVFADGQADSLTIRHSGIIVNPIGGTPKDIADIVAGTANGSSGTWRRGDNRIGNTTLLSTTAQTLCDQYFDVSGFNAVATAMAGDGLTLSNGDVCVLTNSMFDRSDLNYTGYSSIGCTGTSGSGQTWDLLTAIRWQAALYVLSSAPSSPSTKFRPPVMWDTSLSARPMFDESDVVDLSSALHGTSVGNLTSGSISYGYTGSTFTGSDYFAGPIISDHQSVSYLSQIAAFNICPGIRSTYGGDIAGVLGQLVCSAFYDPSLASVDSDRLNAYIQFGLDMYGALQTRTMNQSGAGQKAGLTLPPILFAMKALGQTSAYGTDEVLEHLFGASYASATGDTAYTSLTAAEKTNIKQSFFYEEYTCRPVLDTGSGDFSYDVLGGSYRGTIAPSTVQSYNTSVRGRLLQKGSKGQYELVTEPTGTYVLRIDMANQAGDYMFEPYQNAAIADVDGFGHLELDTRPSGLWSGVDFPNSHAGGYFNLYGCTLDIDGTKYQIVGCSENIETGRTVSITSPIHILVDRPLESDPTAATSITIYPFDSSDVGKYYYHREGDERPEWSTRFVGQHGYGKNAERSVGAVFSCLRKLDGNSDKLGSFGQRLETHYWNPTSPYQWMYGNDAGPRNLYVFMQGPVNPDGAWATSFHGMAANEAARNLQGLKDSTP